MNNILLLTQVNIFSDGGSRGNPGAAAYGFVICDDKQNQLYCGSKYLGIMTNNQAEYRGVLAALEYLSTILKNVNDKKLQKINLYLDSKLIVEQMNGNYKIKNEGLKPLYLQIKDIIQSLTEIEVQFSHIPREKNKEADRLVNEELDKNIA